MTDSADVDQNPTRSPMDSLRGASVQGMDLAEPACDAAPQGATPAAVAADDAGSFTPGETESFTLHTGLLGELVVPGGAARAAELEVLAARVNRPGFAGGWLA